jgi:hypothetical protein
VDWRTSPDRGGFTVVNCHTGCDSRDVVSALGLDMRDLFDGDGPRPAAARPAADRRPASSTRPARAAAPAGRPVRDWPASAGELTATYPYVDAAGALVAEIARFVNSAGKSFRVRRPAPERPGWWLTSRPESMPLYRLPEVLAAVAAGRPVYVAEGEKAADALAAAGHAATSKPFGAVKTADDWHPDWRTPLAGARVIVWADRDEPGYRHAAAVAIALEGVAATVAIVRTSIEQDKADAADHFAAGLDFDAVEPVPAELLPAAAGERDNVVKLPRAGRSAQPQWPLPMSQGQWRYSTGDEADGWPRGIYLLQGPRDATEFVRVAPLPYVLERIHRRDGAGRRTGLDYRVSLDAAGTDPVVCDGDEIRGGEWAARLGDRTIRGRQDREGCRDGDPRGRRARRRGPRGRAPLDVRRRAGAGASRRRPPRVQRDVPGRSRRPRGLARAGHDRRPQPEGGPRAGPHAGRPLHRPAPPAGLRVAHVRRARPGQVVHHPRRRRCAR